MSKQPESPRKAGNRLRIIGGRWRGRKLAFPDVPGLRPTPDRVRETLFNWLQADITGSRCLDLFAGSGALGLEALSRGATHCVFVEANRHAAQQIEAHLHTLQCSNTAVVNHDALTFLDRGSGDTRYDTVFLDPPFGQNFIAPCIDRLETGGWLAAGAHIYLESETGHENLSLPPNWQTQRDKTTGQVHSRLFYRRD